MVRFELNLGRHVIGKLFSTFYTVDLDTSMSANRFTTELFRTKEELKPHRIPVGNSNGFAHAKFHLNPYIIQEITCL